MPLIDTTLTITATGDDVRQQDNSPTVVTSSCEILSTEAALAAFHTHAGFRFANSPLPNPGSNGSAIAFAATLSLKATTILSADDLHANISLHSHADAPAFAAGANDVKQRVDTSDVVAVSLNNLGNTLYTDVADLWNALQEVMSLPGYAMGNHLAAIARGVTDLPSSTLTFRPDDFQDANAQPAKLHITGSSRPTYAAVPYDRSSFASAVMALGNIAAFWHDKGTTDTWDDVSGNGLDFSIGGNEHRDNDTDGSRWFSGSSEDFMTSAGNVPNVHSWITKQQPDSGIVYGFWYRFDELPSWPMTIGRCRNGGDNSQIWIWLQDAYLYWRFNWAADTALQMDSPLGDRYNFSGNPGAGSSLLQLPLSDFILADGRWHFGVFHGRWWDETHSYYRDGRLNQRHKPGNGFSDGFFTALDTPWGIGRHFNVDGSAVTTRGSGLYGEFRDVFIRTGGITADQVSALYDSAHITNTSGGSRIHLPHSPYAPITIP